MEKTSTSEINPPAYGLQLLTSEWQVELDFQIFSELGTPETFNIEP